MMDRQIELAKSILESKGYKVEKIKESVNIDRTRSYSEPGENDMVVYSDESMSHESQMFYSDDEQEILNFIKNNPRAQYVYDPQMDTNLSVMDFLVDVMNMSSEEAMSMMKTNEAEDINFDVVFKDPRATYRNFKKAAAGFTGDVELLEPITLGNVTYYDTDSVIDVIFDQAGNIYSFKVISDVVAGIERVLKGWDIVEEDDEEFYSIYISALDKLDYVLGTDFKNRYGGY